MCVCNPGFDGNGYQCDRIKHREYRPRERTEDQRPQPSEEAAVTDERVIAQERPSETCQYCSSYASCVQGQCVCNPGYHGNGQDCTYNCRSGQVWNGLSCDPISEAVECKSLKMILSKLVTYSFFR